MKKQNIMELKDFNFNLHTLVKVPVITVYNSPDEYPRKYVARLWDIDEPTKFIVIRDSLEEIRKTIPSYMLRIAACSIDDPVIVETYLGS